MTSNTRTQREARGTKSSFIRGELSYIRLAVTDSEQP